LAFNAPEQFNDADYLAKPLDVWAFGVSLYAYLTNSLPVSTEGNHQQFVKDHNEANFEEIVNNLDVTTDLKDLLKSILDRNPQRRPSFQEILKSKWLLGKVDEVFSTEIDTYTQKKKVDFISLKPIIQEKARKYFNKDELRD
jgi:serine/threonine protein kinase